MDTFSASCLGFEVIKWPALGGWPALTAANCNARPLLADTSRQVLPVPGAKCLPPERRQIARERAGS
jgi:hypothetical protein